MSEADRHGAESHDADLHGASDGERPPRVLVIGAHPDDCEVRAAGTAARWREAGAAVTFVSMTDGSSGHFSRSPEELAAIRRDEAAAAGRILDVAYEVLPNRDGHLEPTLERRLELIRLIRRLRPDLVLTHRPVDYHPDHRYTATLVQDSAYMVTVPLVCPETPHLAENPVFGSLQDEFTRPVPFRPDVVVDIDAVAERKYAAIAAHESQFFEWLPYNQGLLERVPPSADAAARMAFLRQWVGPWFMTPAGRYRDELVARYGAERAATVALVEAFEISEYGRQPDADHLAWLFPL